MSFKQEDFPALCRILRLLTEAEFIDNWIQVWDEDEIHLSFNMNDVFYWACSDSEDVNPEDEELLLQTYNELKTIEDASLYEDESGRKMHKSFATCSLPLLFASRKRGMRPQGCVLAGETRNEPEVKKLFDQLPQREVDICNPYDDSGEYKYNK